MDDVPQEVKARVRAEISAEIEQFYLHEMACHALPLHRDSDYLGGIAAVLAKLKGN